MVVIVKGKKKIQFTEPKAEEERVKRQNLMTKIKIPLEIGIEPEMQKESFTPPKFPKPEETGNKRQLKEEFIEPASEAEFLENLAEVPAERQIAPFTPPTKDIAAPEKTTDILQVEYQELTAFMANFKRVPILSWLVGAISQENRMSKIQKMSEDILTGVETGRTRPEEVQRELKDMMIIMAQEEQRIKLEANLDIGKLMTGKQTLAELDMIATRKLLIDTELKVATMLRAKIIQDVQAQNVYRPGAGGR